VSRTSTIDTGYEEEPPAAPGDVLVSIRTNLQSGISSPVEYTVSLRDASNVMVVSLEFEADGDMLLCADAIVKSLSGFTALDAGGGAISWTDLGEGIFKGKVTLLYGYGTGGSLTSAAYVDIAKFVFKAKELGEAAIRLTDVRISGLIGNEVVWLGSRIEQAEATTFIVESQYDLNRDGVVDQLDLNIAMLYCQYSEADGDWWDTQYRLRDINGNGITAKMCDFSGDGIINMVDLIELFINYTSK